ncbi:protease [Streptomyces sp. Ru73]|uniref:SSI family serine proteinase inhibitor n=1 Tax=Streptomyces sp. Ru73 TaxID=2080748 RepID=UPI000CDDB80D|nr:SSI family serine proteinase inhibitor [Streptomyces sp. Ru73]POX38310.1 protease [Streptomyces sp. Ru73]
MRRTPLRRGRRVRAALLSAAALGLLPLAAATAPAAAAPPQAAAREVNIVIHAGEGTGGPVIAQATLRCYPTGGSHPRPEAACRELARVHGDFRQLRPLRRACPMIERPVTVAAKSIWEGNATYVVRGYPNLCTASADSAGVFDLARRAGG